MTLKYNASHCSDRKVLAIHAATLSLMRSLDESKPTCHQHISAGHETIARSVSELPQVLKKNEYETLGLKGISMTFPPRVNASMKPRTMLFRLAALNSSNEYLKEMIMAKQYASKYLKEVRILEQYRSILHSSHSFT